MPTCKSSKTIAKAGSKSLAKTFPEILVRQANSCPQIHAWFPAHRKQPRAVHQLARRSVGFARVPFNLSFESHFAPHHLCEIANRNVAPEANIDELLLAVALHQEHARARQIVRIQKFPERFARAPA